MGTAGLRIAADSAAFVDEVRARCGLDVEVVSGEEEARLSYLAATAGLALGDGSLVVFETGGGSSQFTFGRAGRIDERFSVDVGAARFTETFGLGGVVDESVLAAALDAIAAELVRLDGRPTPDELVAIGGAVTNLAAVKHELATYDPEVVQGTVLDVAEIDRQIELYRTSGLEERRADRRPPAGAGRGHPRGRLHRPDRAREARQGLAHRERSWSAPRLPRRALRLVTRGAGAG